MRRDVVRRGFIGPIGDDLPSILMIVLSLTLFFSAVVFAFNAYTDKLEKLRLTEGAVQLGRAAVSQGVVDLTDPVLKKRLDLVKQTYSLDAEVKLEPQACKTGDYFLQYLVAEKGAAGTGLKKLFVCVRR